jgi:hypothetical protein
MAERMGIQMVAQKEKLLEMLLAEWMVGPMVNMLVLMLADQKEARWDTWMAAMTAALMDVMMAELLVAMTV